MTAFENSPVAVIDLGSVSCQLLLTDGNYRLRQGVDTLLGGSAMSVTGKISPQPFGNEALDRTAETLHNYAALIAANHANTVRVVATAAARRATNTAELAELVEQIMGVPLEVLSGEDEGRLAFLGAIGDPGLAPVAADDLVLTIDVGGGSTEFTLGSALDGPTASLSLAIGGSLLSAAYLTSDPPRPEELSAALSVVELYIDDVRREIPALAPALATVAVVGIGAVVTLAAVELGLAEVDPNSGEGDGPLHGVLLERAALEEVFRLIATETCEDRAHNPGLPATRVADIVGACAIVVETMRQFDLDAITVSQRGLADGIAAEMLAAVR